MIFTDRRDAGKKLAEKLVWINRSAKDSMGSEVLVLAIPRGGVVIGDLVASRIGAKLDIVVSRKIAAPFNAEYAIGAVMPDGGCFLNPGTKEDLQVSDQYIATQAQEQIKEIKRRLEMYRGHKEYNNEIEGKIVILVDDGIATGSTIYAAAQWIKAHKCQKLIIAVPVGPKETIERLEDVADLVVTIDAPVSFQAVGEFYEDFSQVTDEEVRTIMHKHGYKPLNYGKSFAEINNCD